MDRMGGQGPHESEDLADSGALRLALPPPRLLIVEDDLDYSHYLLALIRRIPGSENWETLFLSTYEDARRALDATTVDVVVSDFDLPDGLGKDVMAASTHHPNPLRIILTGRPDVAERALGPHRERVHGVWNKDWEAGRLRELLQRILLSQQAIRARRNAR